MTKNKVYVKINGSEYRIVGEEAEDYLFLISRFLDKKIRETLSVNPKHSNTSAAVLTALTITDELFKIQKEHLQLKKDINEPGEKLDKLNKEFDEVKIAYITLNNEYEAFKQKVADEKDDIDVIQKSYEDIYSSYIKKNEEYENLLKESLELQEINMDQEKEIADLKFRMDELKSELLENEIEHVKINKEFKDFKESYGKKNKR